MTSDFMQASWLAIIQGLTEFLPISSSAHLILPSVLLGWDDQGLTFDIAVHVGTLLAVLGYFWRDVMSLLGAWLSSLSGQHSETSRLAWLLIIATIPAGSAGLLLGDLVEAYARSALVIASASIFFGLILYRADRYSKQQAEGHLQLWQLSWRQAILIGFAQALALIPGTSRSGITMTAALFCKLGRREAARFSFLLSIPIIAVSGLLRGMDLLAGEGTGVDVVVLVYATLLSAVVAWLCIHYFLKLIERMGFLPFVLYRVVLGLGLLAFYWFS